MAKNSTRFQTWAASIVITLGVLLVAIVALPIYLKATARPVHPEPRSVPSVMQTEPLPQWANAVSRAQQIARAAMSAQNMPGLSVAVGAGGEMVWAEGFGWTDIKSRGPVTPDKRFR